MVSYRTELSLTNNIENIFHFICYVILIFFQSLSREIGTLSRTESPKFTQIAKAVALRKLVQSRIQDRVNTEPGYQFNIVGLALRPKTLTISSRQNLFHCHGASFSSRTTTTKLPISSSEMEKTMGRQHTWQSSIY